MTFVEAMKELLNESPEIHQIVKLNIEIEKTKKAFRFLRNQKT